MSDVNIARGTGVNKLYRKWQRNYLRQKSAINFPCEWKKSVDNLCVHAKNSHSVIEDKEMAKNGGWFAVVSFKYVCLLSFHLQFSYLFAILFHFFVYVFYLVASLSADISIVYFVNVHLYFQRIFERKFVLLTKLFCLCYDVRLQPFKSFGEMLFSIKFHGVAIFAFYLLF